MISVPVTGACVHIQDYLCKKDVCVKGVWVHVRIKGCVCARDVRATGAWVHVRI